MVRNTASQRTDLLPWALAHDALCMPVVGACAIVVAPPADHPVLALGAATDTCPPKRQRGRARDARIVARERLVTPAATIAAFKIFMHAFERA